MIIIFVLLILALPPALSAALEACGMRASKMSVFGGWLLFSPLVAYTFIHTAGLIGMPATEFAVLALEFISFLVFIPIGIILLVLNLIFGWKNNDRRKKKQVAPASHPE